jgi:hypothetical protein
MGPIYRVVPSLALNAPCNDIQAPALQQPFSDPVLPLLKGSTAPSLNCDKEREGETG